MPTLTWFSGASRPKEQYLSKVREVLSEKGEMTVIGIEKCSGLTRTQVRNALQFLISKQEVELREFPSPARFWLKKAD